jgi:hypothetical protein
MKRLLNHRELLANMWQRLKWTVLVVPVGVLSGLAGAFFLWSLDRLTELRWQHGWLQFFLPAAGVVISLIYHHFGKSVEAGNNLILEQIHTPGGGVPLRM